MEKIKFQLEDGTEVEFYVEEQTRIGGTAYLLVSDSLDDEATASDHHSGTTVIIIFISLGICTPSSGKQASPVRH